MSDQSEPHLYEATADQLLAIVRGTGREVGTLLMVGHNPGLLKRGWIGGMKRALTPMPPKISGDALLSARATLGRVLLSRPGDGLAGLVYCFERDLRDQAGILDHVLEALSNEAALNGGEILNRPAMRELAQALKIALELLLSQAIPFTRSVLTGLGQHGPELRDRFHVLPGLPGEPFTLLTGEAQRACELIGGILEPLRGGLYAAL